MSDILEAMAQPVIDGDQEVACRLGEWRMDPKTGRDVCLGTIENNLHSAALYAEGSNGKLYLVTSRSGLGNPVGRLAIRERLGDAQFALRATIVSDPGKQTTEFWADANGEEQQQPDD